MRKLLTRSELETFKRWGVPIRYVRGEQRKRIFERDHHECQVCEGQENLTVAHRFPYWEGILKFGYTPDWLNRDENLVVTCRRRCNAMVEDLTVEEVQDEPEIEDKHKVRLGPLERSLLQDLAQLRKITLHDPDLAFPSISFVPWEDEDAWDDDEEREVTPLERMAARLGTIDALEAAGFIAQEEAEDERTSLEKEMGIDRMAVAYDETEEEIDDERDDAEDRRFQRKMVPVLLRLEKKGYVLRRGGKIIRRSVDFYLTQKARDDARLRKVRE